MSHIAALLAGHFIADFLLQPRWMALRKSSELRVLAVHCGIQGVVLAAVSLPFVSALDAAIVGIINAGLHAAIDWNIWRGYKRHALSKGEGFKWWEDHWFYATIGADQMLHGLTLVLSVMVVT